MGKVIVYIATSLDGYIATKNDGIAWLEKFNSEGEDYGWGEFIATVGTVIMGARTYGQMLHYPERMLLDKKCYVLGPRMPVSFEANVEFYEGDLAVLIEKITHESDQTIFIMGGGQVVSSFLNAHLIDEIWQFVAPVILGDGIPLYSQVEKEIGLKLIDTNHYKSGLVRLRYDA